MLSIAAGVTIATLEAAAASGVAVVRAMPNTPALVGAGVSAIAGGRHAAEADLDVGRADPRRVGIVVRVPEHQLDAVTGLTGSGPAYVFLVAEALIDAGVSPGSPRETVERMVAQLLVGSATLLAERAIRLRCGRWSRRRAARRPPGCACSRSERRRAAFIDAVVAATAGAASSAPGDI